MIVKFFFRLEAKNVNISAFSGCRQDRFEVMMLPLTLNALSEGTEVAGIHKYFRASEEAIYSNITHTMSVHINFRLPLWNSYIYHWCTSNIL